MDDLVVWLRQQPAEDVRQAKALPPPIAAKARRNAKVMTLVVAGLARTEGWEPYGESAIPAAELQDEALRHLAEAAYSDRPGCREEWKQP